MSMFERLSSLLEQVSEKTAAANPLKDPGSQDGASSHPTAKTEDPTLRKPVEGEQSSVNTQMAKEVSTVQLDNKSEMTPASAPKDEEQQLGQGVGKAKPTGEDPAVERDYKGKPTDKRDGEMGGTSHPASGSLSDGKCANLAELPMAELYKLAADLGNQLAADLAMQIQPQAPQTQTQTNANQAAAAGYKAAEVAAPEAMDKLAADVVTATVEQAWHTADLVASHLAAETALLKKAAEEGDDSDPTEGKSEGGDAGASDAGAPSGDAEKLLQQMSGGDGGAAPQPTGGDPGAAGPGAGPGADAGLPQGAPPEMGQMNEQQALQELAMALQELGIDLPSLAAMAQQGGPQEAPKMASYVDEFKKSGKFQFSEAKRGSAERKVRDYMKDYISEMGRRSRS